MMRKLLARFRASHARSEADARVAEAPIVAEQRTSELRGPPEPQMPFDIQEEGPEHWAAVDKLTREAFGGDYEADLADRLRHEGLVVGAFVAVAGDQVIGHIMLSDVPTEVGGRTVRAACLAPLSVCSLYRRQGVGAELLDAGVRSLRERGYQVVFVLGDTTYYSRFGFSSAKARKIDSPFYGETFMALELVPGALTGEKGSAKYPKAFQLGV
jgi:putative acetyltransferase